MDITTQPLSYLDKLPFNSNLDSIFKLKAYIDTPDGSAQYTRYKAAHKANQLVKRWVPIAAVAIIIVAFIAKMLFSHFMFFVLLCAALYLAMRGFKMYLGMTEKKYTSGRWVFANDLARTISATLGGYYYVFYDGQIFFYNDRLCIYADAGAGGLTAYNKACIKKVNIEHVHLGSTTVSHSNTTDVGFTRGSFNSNVYGDHGRYRGTSTNFSSTKTTANTQTLYEWKLDILTSFIEQPHITIVFPDNKDGEETVKRACALLS